METWQVGMLLLLVGGATTPDVTVARDAGRLDVTEERESMAADVECEWRRRGGMPAEERRRKLTSPVSLELAVIVWRGRRGTAETA